MTETYYLNGKAYTFDTQEELDEWLAANHGASKTNDKVDFKPSTDFNVEPVKQNLQKKRLLKKKKFLLLIK